MENKDYVNAILKTKQELIVDEETEKAYPSTYVNRALSNYYDTILYSNEINRRDHLDNKLKFDFFINSIRSMKRPYVEREKKQKNDDIECVKKAFGFSHKKALEALRILDDEQIQKLKEETDVGGLRK